MAGILLGVGLLAASVGLGLCYRWQYFSIAPRRYRELKQAGRFKSLPETWEELVRLCNEPPSALERNVGKMAGMDDRRVFYRRFVANELIPAGFVLHLSAISTILGLLLIVIGLFLL